MLKNSWASSRVMLCCKDGNGIEDEDEDYDLDEQGMDGESGVQLGTVVPFEGPTGELLFKNIDWHGWDGGKAGGWPVRSICILYCTAGAVVLLIFAWEGNNTLFPFCLDCTMI